MLLNDRLELVGSVVKVGGKVGGDGVVAGRWWSSRACPALLGRRTGEWGAVFGRGAWPALRGAPRSAALVELLDAVELGSVRAVWIALTADGGARLVKRKVSSWGR